MVSIYVKMIIVVMIVKFKIYNVQEAYVLMIYYLRKSVYIVKDMVLVKMENVYAMKDIVAMIVVNMLNV